MSHDPGAVAVAKHARAPEVIRMGVRDDDGVDVARGAPGSAQPVGDRSPRRWAGQARVYDGHALLVLEQVHVHVPESGHADRQLAAQHTGRHLGHLGGRRLLLLPLGCCSTRCHER